jgi:hypothetical protein
MRLFAAPVHTGIRDVPLRCTDPADDPVRHRDNGGSSGTFERAASIIGLTAARNSFRACFSYSGAISFNAANVAPKPRTFATVNCACVGIVAITTPPVHYESHAIEDTPPWSIAYGGIRASTRTARFPFQPLGWR